MHVSRRGFLTGRRPAPDRWDALIERLSALAPGRVGQDRPVSRAVHVRVGELDSVPQIAALARTHDVALCLAAAPGLPGAAPSAGQCVVLEMSDLTACLPVPDVPGAWLAEPGCRLGDLAGAGLAQFECAPAAWTLAQWAAAPGHRWGGDGVRAADVLFDDGTIETLGVFGAARTRPLRSARVRQLVPALFELARQALPPAHPLQALRPAAGEDINLARVLLGHAGRLALPLRWLLVADAGAASVFDPACALGPAAGAGVDTTVQQAFDPAGRFGGLVPCLPGGATAVGATE